MTMRQIENEKLTIEKSLRQLDTVFFNFQFSIFNSNRLGARQQC